jgi:hypothetical protein
MRAPVLVAPLVALIGALPACDRAPAEAADPLERAFLGLCDAGALASEGRLEEAGRTFQDRSHEFLHELAAETQEEDPAAAAALLEAKQRVEAALAEPDPDPDVLSGLLADLRRAFAAAARAVGDRVPACREPR